ncbi:MAG: NAD(P)/FAD-dependent oxidoreductase [Cyclobacteriaceae bacterium]
MHKAQHIVIVGAGLVGSMLALYLVRRGYRVQVYERRADMRKAGYDHGRSINLALSNRGLAALHELGLEETIRATTVAMKGRMMHALDGTLSYLPYGTEGQYINSVSRSGLNLTLLDAAERAGVEFHFEHRCQRVNLEQTEAQFEHHGPLVMAQGDILLGTDGAFSAVRGAFQLTDRFNYSQTFIDHAYKELTIPADQGTFRMESHALHIWPRESYMLIALPNPGGDFTCTLFYPAEGPQSFAQLHTKEQVDAFFRKQFPDAHALMPALTDEFMKNPTSSLLTVRCFPWVRNHAALLGDAAHAILPFFGQGMNAGFEDCRVLNQLLDEHHDEWDAVLPVFQQLRKVDADAIAQLAYDNFIEMRDLVADPEFLLRKKIEAHLHKLFPDRWIPLYSMVTFHEHMRYSEALATGRKQQAIMDEVMRTKDLDTRWTALDFAGIVARL